MNRANISTRLKTAIRASGLRRWQLARAHGFHPNILSGLLTGARDADVNDSRVTRLAESLGVPAAAVFQTSDQQDDGAGDLP